MVADWMWTAIILAPRSNATIAAISSLWNRCMSILPPRRNARLLPLLPAKRNRIRYWTPIGAGRSRPCMWNRPARAPKKWKLRFPPRGRALNPPPSVPSPIHEPRRNENVGRRLVNPEPENPKETLAPPLHQRKKGAPPRWFLWRCRF